MSKKELDDLLDKQAKYYFEDIIKNCFCPKCGKCATDFEKIIIKPRMVSEYDKESKNLRDMMLTCCGRMFLVNPNSSGELVDYGAVEDFELKENEGG